jgi:hypothetical protein
VKGFIDSLAHWPDLPLEIPPRLVGHHAVDIQVCCLLAPQINRFAGLEWSAPSPTLTLQEISHGRPNSSWPWIYPRSRGPSLLARSMSFQAQRPDQPVTAGVQPSPPWS